MTEPTAPLEGIIISPDEAGQLVTVQERPVLEIFTTPGLVPAILDRIRTAATEGFTADLTTDKGRKAIASQAFKVAKSKTYLDNLGKDEVARLKELPKQVDAARKTLRDGLDALADDIRKPLTEWEAKREGWKRTFSAVQNLPSTLFNATAAVLEERLERLKDWDTGPGEYEEMAGDAASIKLVTVATIQEMLEKRQKWEADQAELQRLREADEKRKREEREEELRKEGEARAKAALVPAPLVTHPEAYALAAATPPLPQVVGVTPEGTIVQAPLNPIMPPLAATMDQADALRRGEPLTQAAADVEHRRTFNREALADLLKVLEDAQVEGDDPIDPAGQRDIAGKAILNAIYFGKVRHIAITY